MKAGVSFYVFSHYLGMFLRHWLDLSNYLKLSAVDQQENFFYPWLQTWIVEDIGGNIE